MTKKTGRELVVLRHSSGSVPVLGKECEHHSSGARSQEGTLVEAVHRLRGY